MEYLTIEGEVKLNQSNDTKVCQLIDEIKEIKFKDKKSINVSVTDNRLSMQGEGELSTVDVNQITTLLNKINLYITEQSYIVINRARWEIRMLLKCPDPVIAPLALLAA